MSDQPLRAVEITRDNVGAACRIAVHPSQQNFVAPVPWSLAEAYVSPEAWPRLIMRGDTAVGFVMAGFDADADLPFFRSGVWRLNVAADVQRGGVGRFAVGVVFDEARRRGFDEAYVLWVEGDGGPAPFYEKLGFVPTGERFDNEVVARITLD